MSGDCPQGVIQGHICGRIYIERATDSKVLKFYHNMIDCNNDIMKFIAKKTDGHSSRVIGRNLSMLRSEYNINPNCISRDVFVSNLFIRLSDNEEERYTGALVRELCNVRDGV